MPKEYTHERLLECDICMEKADFFFSSDTGVVCETCCRITQPQQEVSEAFIGGIESNTLIYDADTFIGMERLNSIAKCYEGTIHEEEGKMKIRFLDERNMDTFYVKHPEYNFKKSVTKSKSPWGRYIFPLSRENADKLLSHSQSSEHRFQKGILHLRFSEKVDMPTPKALEINAFCSMAQPFLFEIHFSNCESKKGIRKLIYEIAPSKKPCILTKVPSGDIWRCCFEDSSFGKAVCSRINSAIWKGRKLLAFESESA
eukprot:TRINITY_DN1541_c0_g1_i1.p1 TRINITY_DN1541_c0_g1~~TRINITY_DN1541_c0_g1_i1.p1  ORF type:complete len:257 (-),score=38.62 TRINITY_DN1541_c0_g1_i1:535-1305(-)